MSFIAVALIYTSAFMYALWNFVRKRRGPSLAFFFIAAFAAAIMSPLLVVHRNTLPLIPIFVWALGLATGVLKPSTSSD